MATKTKPNNSTFGEADDNPFGLAAIQKTAVRLPSRICLHALPKWGKTSFAAHSPNPIFIMSRGEDGLVSLMSNGQLPDTVAHFPKTAQEARNVKSAVDALLTEDHNYRTVVIDTINGVERLIAEDMCVKLCEGNWDKFGAFGKTAERIMPEFTDLLGKLDRLRTERGMGVILLAHSVVKTFRNPEGDDYDRWEPTLEKGIWALLNRWLDVILFGGFEVFTDKKDPKATKGKAMGGQRRILYSEYHAAYDAGNRLGLPAEIDCGDSAAEAWAQFAQAVKGE